MPKRLVSISTQTTAASCSSRRLFRPIIAPRGLTLPSWGFSFLARHSVGLLLIRSDVVPGIASTTCRRFQTPGRCRDESCSSDSVYRPRRATRTVRLSFRDLRCTRPVPRLVRQAGVDDRPENPPRRFPPAIHFSDREETAESQRAGNKHCNHHSLTSAYRTSLSQQLARRIQRLVDKDSTAASRASA